MLNSYQIPCWMPILVERFLIIPSQAEAILPKLGVTSVDELAELAAVSVDWATKQLVNIELLSKGIFDQQLLPAADCIQLFLDQEGPQSSAEKQSYNIWEVEFCNAVVAFTKSDRIYCQSTDRNRAFSGAMALREKGFRYAYAVHLEH